MFHHHSNHGNHRAYSQATWKLTMTLLLNSQGKEFSLCGVEEATSYTAIGCQALEVF